MTNPTDYDKAFYECNKESKERFDFYNFDALHFAFQKGYEYGKKQSAADHERNLIALGDEYMTAREEAFNKSYSKFCESSKGLNVGLKCTSAYQQGWNDADSFDALWALKHPSYLLNRLLHDHPDIIETEVKARMKDLENERSDHFADVRKMRYEIAKDIYIGCLISRNNDMRGQAWRNLQSHAKECVEAADALIKELEKEE